MALFRPGHKPCALIKFRRQKCRTAYCMLPLRLRNHLGKVCALAATMLILPVLANAQTQNQGGNIQGQNGNIPVVPEANAVWV